MSKNTSVTAQMFYKEYHVHWDIIDGKGNFIARCFDAKSADYIVKACNEYDNKKVKEVSND
jgi:hypothetical protein